MYVHMTAGLLIGENFHSYFLDVPSVHNTWSYLSLVNHVSVQHPLTSDTKE